MSILYLVLDLAMLKAYIVSPPTQHSQPMAARMLQHDLCIYMHSSNLSSSNHLSIPFFYALFSFEGKEAANAKAGAGEE